MFFKKDFKGHFFLHIDFKKGFKPRPRGVDFMTKINCEH